MISAAKQNSVGLAIFTSSDKAVNPTNVMGTSKLMGERLMTAANSHKKKKVQFLPQLGLETSSVRMAQLSPFFINKSHKVVLSH